MTSQRTAACFFLLCLLLPFAAAAQAPTRFEPGSLAESWRPLPVDITRLAGDPVFEARRGAFTVRDLDASAIESRLLAAPLRGSVPVENEPEILLPRPDGSLATWRVARVPTMDAKLSARFPEIRSYELRGPDGAIGRLTSTPRGLHALTLEGGRFLRLQPITGDLPGRHVAFEEAPFLDAGTPACGSLGESLERGPAVEQARPKIASGDTLRTYRLAVATTGEFYAARGGNDDDVLAAIVVDVDRVNLLYGLELAIEFTIIDDTTDLFYTDPMTDPYTDGTPCTMRTEAAADIPAVIGEDAFDIGHVLGAVSAGGCAGGSNVCTGQKANGASTLRTDMAHPPGHEDYGGYRLMMHEIGHQFGAGHTWNATNAGNCTNGQYSAGTAVEPSSGTTIMSYSGTCSPQDIRSGVADAYFHTFSHEQIVNFSTTGAGDDCAMAAASGNSAPNVDAGPDWTIPRGTPFVLTGSATDPDGDALTFTWEQYDLAAGRLGPNQDDGASPLFRSFPPSANGNVRTFPQLSDIVNNTLSIGEVLPSTDRTMTFRLTARDNRSVGGVDSDTTVITTDGNAFRVTDPNGADVLAAGCAATVEWIVGSGDEHATLVDVLCSDDGGLTFPTVLATDVPIGDGEVEVDMPCAPTTQGRVRVQAVDNIFFDISSGDFEIVAEPPTGTVMAEGGAVDESCERLVEFTAVLSDDCGLSAADVEASSWILGGEAEVGEPEILAVQDGADGVTVTGTVLVSEVVDCPAELVISLNVPDSCGAMGNAATLVEIVDETPPQLSQSPPDLVVECDSVPEAPVVTASDTCAPWAIPVNFEESEEEGACPGESTITREWTAVDGCGNVAQHVQVIEVVDTTPPVITPDEDEAACLWPPNHRMACFTTADFAPEISDNCSEPIEWRFVGCASDQEDLNGDGNTEPDCVVADDGQSFCVRAERSGLAPEGRTYTVTIEATDACGNTTLEPVGIGRIRVPHDATGAAGCLKANDGP